VRYFHHDVPANGEFKVAVAGEMVDTDGDDIENALRFAAETPSPPHPF
jgi:hypothetical protein